MASAPDGSTPSPTTSSPTQSKEKDSTPPYKESGSPPPESSSKTPEKSPPPPKKSSPPPPSTPTPPASPPPSTPTPSTPSKPSPSNATPTQPAPTNNQGNIQNNVPAAAAIHTPQSPLLTSRITPPTPHSNTSTHSPPPPRLHSPPSKIDHIGSESDSSSSQSFPIILGLSASVVLLLAIILTIIIVACCRRKKKSKYGNHIYYHNHTPSPGEDGYAQVGYDANTHVNNVVSPPGGNVGHGGWAQTPSTPQAQGQTSYSSDMSANIHGQVLPPLPAYATPLGINQISFTYEELSRATNGFSQANLLGQGGFGYVYKGVLPSGKEVAVKSLKSGSGQGEREFQAEVETISRVHHRHLVSLVGYSISGDERMLAYEFLPNNTLEFHLHEQDPLDWHTRLKIALGAAKGLAYLHEDCHPRIIHRDIKSANILLDFTFEAKVADFGLARLTQDNNTHVSTRVMGTFGYLAPEYALSGKLTDKSDVFSFGVVLLELITGRRPLDLKTNDESLVDWARPLCAIAAENGNFSALVDPRLENNFDHQEMTRMVACAAASIRHSARRRPKMRQVVRALEGDIPLDEINGVVAASQTSRFSPTNDTNENESSSYSYTADMEKFRKLVMESQEYGSSSNYGNTSEYGLHPSSSSSSGSSGQIAPKQQL